MRLKLDCAFGPSKKNKENPRMNRTYVYTKAISKLLFLDDEQKHMIGDFLTKLKSKSVNYSDDMINSLIRACFEWIVMPGLYEVKYQAGLCTRFESV